MNRGAYQAFDGLIIDMRRRGFSLNEIGDVCGVSRQRIYQILDDKYGSTERGGLTRCAVAKLFNTSWAILKNLERKNILKPMKRTYFVIYPEEQIKELQKYIQFRGICRICGQSLPLSRSAYCSSNCSQKGRGNPYKYAPGYRSRYKTYNKRWRERTNYYKSPIYRNYQALYGTIKLISKRLNKILEFHWQSPIRIKTMDILKVINSKEWK